MGDKLLLQRVKGDHGNPSTGTCKRWNRRKQLLDLPKLLIHRDSNGLKNDRRWVHRLPLTVRAAGWRSGLNYDLCELSGTGKGPITDDSFSDRPRLGANPTLLQEHEEILFSNRVEELFSCLISPNSHPHIQRFRVV
jgi:hypothetical protein